MNYKINSVFSSVCYRIGNTIIDPGDIWDGFYKVDSVLLTHCHFDHIYGLNELMRLNPNVQIYTNEFGRSMLLDDKLNMSRYHETPFVFEYPQNIVLVTDNEELALNNILSALAVFTPGHNPSCITWQIGDAVFTGDSYIPGIKTVTNLPGGDKMLARRSELLIKKIADGKTVYPGHKI